MTAEAVASAAIPAAHRRWLVVNALCITAVLNLLINTGIALAQAHGDHVVAWSMRPTTTSLMGNTLGTLFMLPLITTLLVSAAIRREQQAGTLAAIDPPHYGRLWSALCVRGALRRGLRFAVATFLALAPIAAIVIVLFARHGASPTHFVVAQVALCVVLGAVVTPFIALAAMTDCPNENTNVA